MGAHILGINLEGPFLNFKAIGAQSTKYLCKPSVKEYNNIITTKTDLVKMITIAPELDGSLNLIKYLSQKGIKVAIGHSLANYNKVVEAVDHGASHITHMYNCMTGLHHRNPGVVGAALDIEALSIELIADGHHISWPAIRLAINQKGTDKTCLITDATHICGLTDGEYLFGEKKVYLKANTVCTECGKLAGSALTLREAVKNTWENTPIPLYAVVKMATKNPAQLAGVAHTKGQIKVGYDADLILFNKNLEILATFIKGQIIK